MKKYYFIIPLLLLLIPFASAYTFPVIEATGQTTGTSGTTLLMAGMTFTTNTSNIVLENATGVTGTSNTKWYVINSSSQIICVFDVDEISADCELPYVGQYSIAGGSDGSSFDRRYQAFSSYPIAGTLLSWDEYTEIPSPACYTVGCSTPRTTNVTTFRQLVKDITFINATAPPADDNATERLQQDVEVNQNSTVTINGVSYSSVVSSAVTIPDAGEWYVTATVPITATASNTATCQITQDGVGIAGSEKSRTLTAGTSGNLLLSSYVVAVSAGTVDLGLECYRTGGGSFDVTDATITGHLLVSKDGDNITYKELNLSGTANNTYSTTITTSNNETVAGLSRLLIAEWTSQIDYSSTNNVTLTAEIAGTNCTPIIRYGASGSSGSASSACYVNSLTNSTSYDIKMYSSGDGTLDGWMIVKEIIIHPSEINMTSLSGINLSGNQTIANVTITPQAGHSTPDIIVTAGVNPSSSSTVTSTFYLTDDSENSSSVSRTTNAGQPGSIVVANTYNSVTSQTVYSLVGSCTDCEIVGGDLLAYMSSDLAASPNEFVLRVNSTYGGSLSEFSVTLSDNRSFTTTTGAVSIPATGELYNITVLESANAAIPHFSNSTTDHNSTNDLTMFTTPYTRINASFMGATVNNFTVNGETTTNGIVYLRIFNETTEVNITDAVSASGTNLSDQTANVTANIYLQNYTFNMLTANAFNFSIYDEITQALITENMTVEIISSASAGTYQTNNGTLYLELLTPSDYTIRYYSDDGTNYTQRDYIQTLVDRQRYDISLYGLLNAEATDMVVIVKDTSGDPVQDAIVKLLRYYTSCNCYEVVEMAQTSAAGDSYFVVDAYDGHYKFAVEYESQTEFLSSSPENFIPSNGLVTRTITINLGSAYFESFRALTDVGRTLTYNNDTKGLSFTWNDPSGIVSQGCLYAEYLDGVHYTQVTPVCQEGATGSVVMTLNNTVSSYKYYAELDTSTTYSEYVVFSGTIDKIADNLLNGNTGLGAFLGAGVVLVLALMFSFSAIAVVIVTALGAIAMSVLGLASLSTVFITGFATLVIGIGVFLMRS